MILEKHSGKFIVAHTCSRCNEIHEWLEVFDYQGNAPAKGEIKHWAICPTFDEPDWLVGPVRLVKGGKAGGQ
jgi:hypothetical protein